MAAAAAARKGGLRKTPAGDQMRAEIVKATARVCHTCLWWHRFCYMTLAWPRQALYLLLEAASQQGQHRRLDRECSLKETETKTKRERALSSRNANAHIADGPLSCLDFEGALPDLA